MKLHISRVLRKNQTSWEQKLWQVIRNRNLNNAKFRRQFSIPPYVVDFICLESKLIIELDGSQHTETDHTEKDLVRKKYLEKLGYKVLRIWNIDIDNNLEGIVQSILGHL